MNLLNTVAAVALLAGLSVSAPALADPSTTKGATPSTVTTQLPRTVVPSHYDLTITPDAAAMTFTGKAAISVDVKTATPSIKLQAADLTFSSVTLRDASGKSLGAAKVAVDPDAQTATFTFAKPVQPGSYVLDIAYAGKINTQANGLFALDYKDEKGTSHRALFTQFENSDARRFMPSWDEPFYKATFDLKAVVPSDQMAVGNMPVASRKDLGGGKTLVTFGESPKMSTYLLFFGLGDFERKTTQAGGAEIGMITKKGSLDQGDYALNASAEILPYYNDYFGTAYPLPKLDHIAAPGRSQFFSAMENWGAIFYFENALLLDPKIASDANRERIFTVVAHEMAHQWFGDLVTMSWWDDLWLNEGFASWMESRATEKFHPEWHPELTAVGGREAAMSQDSLAATHPIINHIATVEEASQAFDTITYQKGEAVIRMLEAYAGSDEWRDGVRAYMKRYNHSNTVTDDLWREIDATSGKPITQIAHDFTLQPGIPLIKASAACTDGATTLSLTQGEFTRDRPNKKPLSWHVPINAASVDGDKAQTLLAGSGTLAVKGCGPVVVNAGQTGYYRVLYSPAMFAGLVKSISSLAPVDQLGMIGDSEALGLTGAQKMSDVLDLVAALPADALPQVTERASDVVFGLYDVSQGSAARRAALMKMATEQYLPVLDKLGWTPKDGEDPNAANLRNHLISRLGYMGVPAVVDKARELFANPDAIPPSTKLTVLGVVADNADAATWDKLHEMAKTETSAQVQTALYGMLGDAKDMALGDKAMALALSDEPSKTTGAVILSSVGREHPDQAFDYILAHYDAVMKLIDGSAATRFVPRVAQGSHDPAMEGKLSAYAAKYLPESARRPTEEAIGRIKDRIRVRDTRLGEVDAWLKAHGY